MASRTRTPIYCECGHEGIESCKENDSPFSRMWERYSLTGFSGNNYEREAADPMDKSPLEHMNPTCRLGITVFT